MIEEIGYAFRRSGSRTTIEFKDQIIFLLDNGIIKLCDINEVPLNATDPFQIQLIREFNMDNGFVVLTAHEIDTLLTIPQDKSKLFALYLYMKSFMFQKSESTRTNMHDDSFKPSAFYANLDHVPQKLNLSKSFVNKSINQFVKNKLLRKKVVGSYINSDGVRMNAPNIYVINDQYADEEIELVLSQLKHTYQIKEFLPMLNRNKKGGLSK